MSSNKVILAFFVFFGLIIPVFFVAGIDIKIPGPQEPEEIIDRAVNWIFWISVAIVPLMVLFGAFMLASSGGESKRLEQGKKIILWSLVGFSIAFLGKMIVAVIKEILGI